MKSVLERRGIGFHVDFMSYGHGERAYWGASDDSLGFSHRFWKDRRPRWIADHLHWNPGLVGDVTHVSSREAILLSGPYCTPTAIALSLRIRRENQIGWLEANTRTPGKVRGPIGAFKRLVLSRASFLAVPGSEGEAHAKLLFNSNALPFKVVRLPNIVDEDLYRRPSEFTRADADRVKAGLGLPLDRPIAILPARLARPKAIPEFLSCLSPESLGEWRIAIVGDGPERTEVESMIARNRLVGNVFLVPPRRHGDMPPLYWATDLMVLPSFQDPNPLCVVEALWAGLPVALSDRLGNTPEAVEVNGNGWVFDPTDRQQVLATLDSIRSTTPESLREMAIRSLAIAERHWSSKLVVERFLDSVGLV